ncbi:MAG TPA: universal stress protein, partial [Flavobacteriales bacterium]|nr:universal stress protein [Flavobacteriales bacterium]
MNLLCPTDLSLAADIALSYAGHIAKHASGEITLFHALAKKEAAPDDATLGKAHEVNLGQLAALGVKVHQVLRAGPFMKEIAAESAKGHSL